MWLLVSDPLRVAEPSQIFAPQMWEGGFPKHSEKGSNEEGGAGDPWAVRKGVAEKLSKELLKNWGQSNLDVDLVTS